MAFRVASLYLMTRRQLVVDTAAAQMLAVVTAGQAAVLVRILRLHGVRALPVKAIMVVLGKQATAMAAVAVDMLPSAVTLLRLMAVKVAQGIRHQ
jgi:hypothetical protein